MNLEKGLLSFIAKQCRIFIMILAFVKKTTTYLLRKYLKSFHQLLLQEEKSVALNNVAASIAHELKTPLRTISLAADNLKLALLPLLDSCQSIENKQSLSPLMSFLANPDLRKELREALTSIEEEVRTSFAFINMLLTNANEKAIVASGHEVCMMSACVQDCLSRYPFMHGEREIVQCDLQNDFEFLGNELLLIHVIFNLLKNALYYVQQNQNPQITIKLEYGNSKNILRFRDNGIGIAREHRKHIFEKFYGKTKNGSGIGLAFCRSVMESFHGHIICNSRENEFTEFILYFPVDLSAYKNYGSWYNLIQKDINVLRSNPGI